MTDRRSHEKKEMIDRRVLIGTGSERAVTWGIVAALVVWFGVPALDAFALVPPRWTVLGVWLVATVGAVGLAYSGGGVGPCFVLLFPPLAAGAAAVVEAPSLSVPYADPTILPVPYADPTILPVPYVEPVITSTALAVVLGVAAYLVGRGAAALVGRFTA